MISDMDDWLPNWWMLCQAVSRHDRGTITPIDAKITSVHKLVAYTCKRYPWKQVNGILSVIKSAMWFKMFIIVSWSQWVTYGGTFPLQTPPAQLLFSCLHFRDSLDLVHNSTLAHSDTWLFLSGCKKNYQRGWWKYYFETFIITFSLNNNCLIFHCPY